MMTDSLTQQQLSFVAISDSGALCSCKTSILLALSLLALRYSAPEMWVRILNIGGGVELSPIKRSRDSAHYAEAEYCITNSGHI